MIVSSKSKSKGDWNVISGAFEIWSCDDIGMCDQMSTRNRQIFFSELGMKPRMHLVEIGLFSLNHVIVRPTEIIKDLCKAST